MYSHLLSARSLNLARLSLENEMHALAAQCTTLQSKSEMEALYQKYCALTSREFTVSARPRPGQYKFFWTDELDELAKERSRSHRAAKLLNMSEAWA